MFPTSTVVTSITADRIRAAETARRASSNHTNTQPASRRRSRRLRIAMRVALSGLR